MLDSQGQWGNFKVQSGNKCTVTKPIVEPILALGSMVIGHKWRNSMSALKRYGHRGMASDERKFNSVRIFSF